jgi:hypothetical protein
MASFLLLWNPKRSEGWDASEAEELKRRLSRGEEVTARWSTGRSKRDWSATKFIPLLRKIQFATKGLLQ